MFLLCLYLIVLIIVIILFLYSKKEGFETMTTSTQNTTNVLPTTSSSFEDMDVIDFSELDSEKILRDEQSKELNNCLGKYVNRRVKPLRDVSEIMFSRVEDCENIFEATEVDNKKKYFEQMEYW